MSDDLIALFFAIRPDCQQSIQPVLRGLLITDKIAFRHAEEGKPRTAVVEVFRGSILPLLRRFLHTFQRFPRLLCAGNIVRQRDGTRNHSGGDGEPYGRRLAQNRQESLPAAARLAH